VNSAFGGKGGPVGEMVTGLSATPEKVNRTIDDVNLRVNTLLDKLSVIADTLDEISVNTRGAIGNLSTSLDQIAGDARGAIGNLSTSLDQIAGDTRGAIGNLSTSLDQITGDARGIIGNLSTSLDEISQNLKTMTEDLANTRGLATRLLDPKGSIGTFLDDQNALYAQVDSALKSANEIITQIRGFVEFVNGTRPQISSILEKGRDTLDQGKDVLEAVKNNPLLKGGVPPQTPQPATLKSYRDEDF
jgi:phospholipid/cholesterol/gamma-HCH transport system substrate-binding protein